MTMNSLSFIRNVLYKLKLDYGFPLDIYRFTSQDIDTKTGKKTVTRQKIEVPLAVILAENDARKFAYSRAFIAENRQFTIGGYFDVGTRVCILDAEDLPCEFIPQLDDYFVASMTEKSSAVRYQVSKVGELMGDYGFLVAVKETKGLEPFQVLNETATSCVGLRQGASNG